VRPAPFITIDALDGVGKTTLVARLAERLGGHALDTPGALLRPLRESVLDALGPCQVARCVFYASTVIAQGTLARRLADAGQPVVMDRYWPSTLAYARARGVHATFSDIERAVPPPDLAILLTLDEPERVARLKGRGLVTDADAETLDPVFRACVERELRRLTTIAVDVTGAPPDEALERVLIAITNHFRAESPS